MQAGGSVQRIAVITVTMVLGALFGVLVSQYAPLFGGVEKFAQPWSEARMNLVLVHVIAVAVLGFVLGLFVLNNVKAGRQADAPNLGCVTKGANRFLTEIVASLPFAPRAEEAKTLEPLLHDTDVLVVEDDPDNADLLAELLGAHGARVRTAGDGPRSLEMVESWTPNVLLIDLGLPRMDGYRLMETLRQRPGLGDATAVAVTGYTCDVELTRHAGFDVCVRKPYDGEALVELILRLRREKRKVSPH